MLLSSNDDIEYQNEQIREIIEELFLSTKIGDFSPYIEIQNVSNLCLIRCVKDRIDTILHFGGYELKRLEVELDNRVEEVTKLDLKLNTLN